VFCFSQEKLYVRAGRRGGRGLFLFIVLEATCGKGARIPQVTGKRIVGEGAWAPWGFRILVVVLRVVCGVLRGLPLSSKFSEHRSVPLDPDELFGFGRVIESDSWVLVVQKSSPPDGKEVVGDLH
jgi:hypothetical protein